MQIIFEPTEYHRYAFEYPFNQETLEFCRSLKSKWGWKEFGFYNKKWRFKKPEIINDIRQEYEHVVVMQDAENDFIEQGAQAQLQAVSKRRAVQIKQKEKASIELKGLKLPLLEYQKLGVEFMLNSGGRTILGDQMGCISGNAEVIINRAGNGRRYLLKDAYERFNGFSSNKGVNWELPSYTRSLGKNEEFRLNRIKKILYKGYKNTITVHAKCGKKKYSISLTNDHELLSSGMWTPAEKLKVGDSITVNGKKIVKKYCDVCKTKTKRATYQYAKFPGACKHCMYRFMRRNNGTDGKMEFLDKDGYVMVSGAYFHPSIKNRKFKSVYKHVLVMEASINKMSYEQWLNIIKYNSAKTKHTFIDSSKFAVHHINRDKQDNRLENLELMTHKEHQSLEGKDYKYRNFKSCFIPDTATITAIKKNGKEDVYDLVMENPDRNFIANGVVVHNCGKTVQALGYLCNEKSIQRTLVVCPASVKYVWEKEIQKFTKLSSYTVNSKDELVIKDADGYIKSYNADLLSSDVVVINYDILKKHLEALKQVKFDCLVLDEFQKFKNSAAQRTKAIKLLGKNIPKKILLSGTPVLSRPVEMFNALQMVDPNEWNSYLEFTRRYCNGHYSRFGWDVSGASNIEELRERIQHCFLRRTKEEVMPELPPKRRSDIPVHLSAAELKNYVSAERSFGEYLLKIKEKTEQQVRRSLMAEQLTKLNELRQITSTGKVDAAIDLINDIISNDEKVVVFSCYNDPLVKIKEALGNSAVVLTGGVSQEERGNAIDQFQNNPNVKVFLGGIKSAGVGITLTASSNVLFLDYSWVPADHAQAEDRCHRIGTTASSVNIYQLYVPGTVDEKMKKLLVKKQEIFDQLIEGTTPDSTSIIDEVLKMYTT